MAGRAHGVAPWLKPALLMSMPVASPKTRLAKAVEHRLRTSPYPAVKRLNCVNDRGRLVLRGQVRTFYEKQVAQEAIADLEGSDEIVNGVEVE